MWHMQQPALGLTSASIYQPLSPQNLSHSGRNIKFDIYEFMKMKTDEFSLDMYHRPDDKSHWLSELAR